VVAFRDVSERHAFEQELSWQANHDPLTRLYNRRYFEKHLEEEVARCQRGGTSALLYLDLDRFKYINDIAGHAAGDQLLIEISQQMRERLRDADLLARLGGDEFAIILRDIADDKVLMTAESFREILEGYSFVYGGQPYRIYGSIGVALIDAKVQSSGEVLANADIACHIAKNKGRNQTHVYEPDSDAKLAMNVDLGWSARLEQALKSDGFVLHYQPIVPLRELDLAALPSEAFPQNRWGDLTEDGERVDFPLNAKVGVEGHNLSREQIELSDPDGRTRYVITQMDTYRLEDVHLSVHISIDGPVNYREWGDTVLSSTPAKAALSHFHGPLVAEPFKRLWKVPEGFHLPLGDKEFRIS
jgi:diguanylate cyclase (GGDEF)-like protein